MTGQFAVLGKILMEVKGATCENSLLLGWICHDELGVQN
jgi:hypothetical protein